MSEENWKFLKSLPFGIVLFPNSKTLELPPLIANGDVRTVSFDPKKCVLDLLR